MAFLVLGANSVSGYTVKNSLRFNSGSSDYLNRTPASSGNLTTWTYSVWIKRANISTAQQMIAMALPSAGNDTQINFASNDQIEYFNRSGGTVNGILLTTQLFRDISAWYHLVFVWDTNNATAGDRMRMYVNGNEITSFSSDTNPSLATQSKFNQNTDHRLGQSTSGSASFNGYMSEINFIDGTALTPSSFGETDTDTGIWKPKAYTGTYGTNGFALFFKNSASLGTDSSGNGNTFTVNNLTSIDQTTDTPTNNFCTINTLTCNDTASLTASEGNSSISGGNDIGATFGLTKGKWYWESKRTNTGTVAHWGVGFTNSWNSSTQIVTGNGSGIFIRNDFVGGYNINGSGSNGFTSISGSTTGSSIANGDIVGVALDLDSATKSITFYQNGSSVGSGTFSYDGTSSTCFPFVRNNSGASSQWNFGNPPYSANSYTDGAGYGNFSYSVPSGYYALCTKNLANFG